MDHTLVIGDYAYSSWSLRGWLLLHRPGLPHRVRHVDFHAGGVAQQIADLAPARTVPALVTPEGAIVWDSLAMAEELATRHPDAGLWPAEAGLRATARSLAAEMHCGFSALRGECPMNLRAAYSGFAPSEETRADLSRIESLWSFALDRSGGPWLCGAWSAADAFFAPVAARIATYGLSVNPVAQGYVAQTLADPAFRRWRAMALVSGADLPWYARDFAQGAWPGPAPLPARPIEVGTPENAACPCSGQPITHLMSCEGRIFGFCNAFCRDKTVADPEAWPTFTALRAAP